MGNLTMSRRTFVKTAAITGAADIRGYLLRLLYLHP